jgi:hypothetical protein
MRPLQKLLPIPQTESKTAHPIIECSDPRKFGHKIIRTNVLAGLCRNCVAEKERKQVELAERKAAKEEKARKEAERRARVEADKEKSRERKAAREKAKKEKSIARKEDLAAKVAAHEESVAHLKEVKRLKKEDHSLADLLK